MKKINTMRIGTIIKVNQDTENLYFRVIEVNKDENYIIGKLCENKSGYPYLTSEKWKIDFNEWEDDIEAIAWVPGTYFDNIMDEVNNSSMAGLWSDK